MRRSVFDAEWIAANYARWRPDVHSRIIQHAAERLALPRPLGLALDIGCGTGLSTRALGKLATRVIGVDTSHWMIRQTASTDAAAYILARAEALPVRSECAELITCSQAFHWCEPTAFLAEATRVLRPGGWLLIYDSFPAVDGVLGDVVRWINSDFSADLPEVPRRPLPDRATFTHAMLEMIDVEDFMQRIPMTRDQFVCFILTQSRSAAAVDSGALSLDALRMKLDDRLAHVFENASLDVAFSGPIFYLRAKA